MDIIETGEHWSETVRCFRLWSEAEEETVNEIISRIKNSISSKPRPVLPPPPGSLSPAVADEESVKEAKDFFERKFNLARGNYKLLIAALSESNQPLSVRGFDFTLFESSIRGLRALTEDYKYGAGIYLGWDTTKAVWPRLRPVVDEEALKAYKRSESS